MKILWKCGGTFLATVSFLEELRRITGVLQCVQLPSGWPAQTDWSTSFYADPSLVPTDKKLSRSSRGQAGNPLLLERLSVTWKKQTKRSCSHPDRWQRAGISLGLIPSSLLCSALNTGLPGLLCATVIVVVSKNDGLRANKLLKMFCSWKDLLVARPNHQTPCS